ncbi:MAG: nucleotidyltransferase domain-containing protein [Candidatus Thorarchaeota archaeon]|jgi:predicted nucleotidyltransferase
MAKKPEILHESREIVYDDAHWACLNDLRSKAISIIKDLNSANLNSFVYGSIARGDIGKSSDIDVIIPSVVPSYKIELAVGAGVLRELVQATPSSVLKGHIHLDNTTVVSFPLFKMMSREHDFYSWGGLANLEHLQKENRVPGVDKRLILIEPTVAGHIESGVIGYEHDVARKLDVNISVAQERVRVLTRRDNVGRTGVYLTRTLHEDENFEVVAKSLKDDDPALRRTIGRRER